jgi:hypothetical protein
MLELRRRLPFIGGLFLLTVSALRSCASATVTVEYTAKELAALEKVGKDW